MATTSRDALAEWLRRRSAVASRLVAVEEALLAGRFARYAARRLFAFVLARAWAIALHVVELTWLAQVFSAKPFVASLALQNATLVADALYWGALEPMRRRARELGESSEAAALVTRWMTVGLWCAFAVVLVPVGRAAWVWHDLGHPPTLLDGYAFVCAVRLAADVVLRTYYSGVFAFRRVHRPVWSAFVGPAVLAAVTVALWDALAGWSFAVALLASVVATRGLLFAFTRRAYRLHRIPSPRFRLGLRLRGARPTLRDALEVAVAGTANTATRLGSVVLLAAVIPSLAPVEGPEGDGAGGIEPFAFSLHLAAPLVLVASQWGLSFYHDWKRLEEDEASTLARHLYVRLIVTAFVVGLFAWAGTVAIVRAYVALDEVLLLLVALLPGMMGLSIWTAVQLRAFARGEFVRQLASSVAMVAVVWAALSATWLGPEGWYLALGAGPWAAIVFHEVLGLWRRRHATGIVTTLGAWSRALAASPGTVIVWEARVARAPVRIVERVTHALGDRGAVVRSGNRILWFERAPFRSRVDWLGVGGGELTELRGATEGAGAKLLADLHAEGRVGRPPPGDLDALRVAHASAFPTGFVVEVGKRPPPAFGALPAAERQTIWREAIRAARGGRGRSQWFVAAWAPEGALDAFFVAPRSRDGTNRSAVERFRAALRQGEGAGGLAARTGARGDARGTEKVKRVANPDTFEG